MRNTTTITKNRSRSKFLGQRRKSFFTRRTAKVGFQFLKINKGAVTRTTMPSGSVRLTFESKATGRTALAYGKDFFHAYQNLVRLFYLKYAV